MLISNQNGVNKNSSYIINVIVIFDDLLLISYRATKERHCGTGSSFLFNISTILISDMISDIIMIY